MNPPHPPKGMRDPVDDPLLPFVVAAKAGDRSAERELLFRVAPTVLAVARRAGAAPEPLFSSVVSETLIATLKALPTFRGDESVRDVVAHIALTKSKLALGTLPDSDDDVLASARLREQGRAADEGRIADLVDRALEDDAAVLVSHVAMRGGSKRSKRRTYPWRRLAILGLAILASCWVVSRLL